MPGEDVDKHFRCTSGKGCFSGKGGLNILFNYESFCVWFFILYEFFLSLIFSFSERDDGHPFLRGNTRRRRLEGEAGEAGDVYSMDWKRKRKRGGWMMRGVGI